MTKRLTILAADDVELNRRILDCFIRKLGHDPVIVRNGQEAVDYCAQQRPDMILMDIVMPVMDGFAATAQIRGQLAGHWIPIIFLSAMTDQADYLHGLEVGGDDYLTKPVNLTLLSAKIGVMSRIVEMQSWLADNHVRLENYYTTTQQEHNLAKHVLERFNTAAQIQQDNIKTWLKAAVHLSGDVICVARSPSGADHVLLADSTGHGLVAAICCLPVVDIFHAMTQRGFGISKIAESLNRKLYSTLPTGHFVAAVIISIHYDTRTISVWNGGIPCCSFLNQLGNIEKDFRSTHPPLATLPPSLFDKQLEQHNWQHDGELIVCSDGVTEARDKKQQQLGQDGVLEIARNARQQNTAEHIAHVVQNRLCGSSHHDDASLVVINCKSGHAPHPSHGSVIDNAPDSELSRWQVRLIFETRQIREQDCLSSITDWVNRLQLQPHHINDVLLIVCELFTHTLDQERLNSEEKTATTHQEQPEQSQHTDITISITHDTREELIISLHYPAALQADYFLSSPPAYSLTNLQTKLGNSISLNTQPQQVTVHYRLR